MINLGYLFHQTSCGYYCLKHIVKRIKIKDKGYMSLYDMKKYLLLSGYSCLCFKVKDLNLVKGKCITLMSFKRSFHYVVIKRIGDKYVYVYDPLFLFVRKVKKEKFLKRWSKICLFYNKI